MIAHSTRTLTPLNASGTIDSMGAAGIRSGMRACGSRGCGGLSRVVGEMQQRARQTEAGMGGCRTVRERQPTNPESRIAAAISSSVAQSLAEFAAQSSLCSVSLSVLSTYARQSQLELGEGLVLLDLHVWKTGKRGQRREQQQTRRGTTARRCSSGETASASASSDAADHRTASTTMTQ